MNFLTQTILAYLLTYKYLALFVVSFLGASILPLPSSAAIVASSALVNQGHFNLLYVFITAFLGNVIADSVGYWLARKYGKPVLYKLRLGWLLESERFIALEESLAHHPSWYIIVSRFEGLANISVNLIAGLANIPYKKYLLLDIIGEALQVGLYVAVGYFFAEQWESASSLISKILLLAVILAVIIIFLFKKSIWKKLSPNKQS